MLRRILTAAIAVLLTVTGLILMEQLLPQISYFLGYNIHSTGLLGYSPLALCHSKRIVFRLDRLGHYALSD